MEYKYWGQQITPDDEYSGRGVLFFQVTQLATDDDDDDDDEMLRDDGRERKTTWGKAEHLAYLKLRSNTSYKIANRYDATAFLKRPPPSQGRPPLVCSPGDAL